MMISAAVAANAQQALGSHAEVVSPEIHGDNTVTFRLNAPGAKSVRVAGDCVGDVEMVKNGEVWEYTTPQPLASELYSYVFNVDGLRVNDPSNVYQLRDVATVSNIFLIKGDKGDKYKVADVPHGTVQKVWYHSPATHTDRRMSIYTPAGYEDGRRRYPVLYLLHGMGGDENAWLELGRASQILDNMIASGEVEPMIVVMPNGNVAMQGAPGETRMGFAQPIFNLPKTMDGTFEISFPEIVTYVDRHFRTKSAKPWRAIAGLSMGGFHSLHISKQYPMMFDYVGLFSAKEYPEKASTSSVYNNMEDKLKAQFADAPQLYWIGIGKDDFLYKENQDFRKMLDADGFKYTYRETDGGHEWRNWRIYLTEFLPLLFKAEE